jgi:hypothetical protein
MHKKCTNKNCQYDHDILKSIHNRKIIEARGLSFISTPTLNELTRASADPNRSVTNSLKGDMYFLVLII